MNDKPVRDQWSSGPSWVERARDAVSDDLLRAIVADHRRDPVASGPSSPGAEQKGKERPR